ncbi:efflux RND transporter permease subunit [Shewanella marina]|uniref:efflux RND transporter permease subunit n=1 Tax=Shewanella marina TaxID=487319 RepID=UPI0004702CBE|nr:efflux RND transporter permease subunit [Shewanella marina]
MSLITTSVKRPVTVWMFMIAVMMFGMVSFSRLAVKLLPDLSYPTLTIRTLYDGAAPVEVEQLISKPVEESVGIVKGLRKIQSISRSGMSDVVLEFEWGTNMDMAALDVREKLDLITLPLDIEKPLILRFNPNLDPIMRVALAIPNPEPSQLKQIRTYADEELSRHFEAISGVAAVRISGGLEQQVHILLDQQKLAQLGLNAEQINQQIAAENINVSAGKVLQGNKEYLVRTLNQFDSLDDLANTIIYQDNQRLIRLREIAQVIDAHKERDNITRINQQQSIELAIYKEGDANTVDVSKRLQQFLQNQPQLPYQLQSKIIYNQAEFIENAVNAVTQAAIWGSLLAMLVIYLFLRDVIATLIISISIPFSVIATFNMMYFADISLNIMSLGGIALAVGLLVDNAIVVLENIDRCKQQGLDKISAAIKGTAQVSSAIIASTLTTLAVFVPLIFVDGIAGALFSDQALTVSFALLASLLVALTAIPMLASRQAVSIDKQALIPIEPIQFTGRWHKIRYYSMKVLSAPILLLFKWLPLALLNFAVLMVRAISWLLSLLMRPLSAAFNGLFNLVNRYYQALLNLALKVPKLTITIAIIVSGLGLALLPKLGVELIPNMNQGEFYLEIQLPPGTEVSQTDLVLAQLASSINQHPQVKASYSQAGSGGLMNADTNRSGEHWGRLQVVLTEPQAYPQVSQILREQLATQVNNNATIDHPALFTFNAPIAIELTGYNLQQLKQSADILVSALAQESRFTDISSSLKQGQPELSIEFDHQRLAALGIDAPTVASRIAHRIGGTVASQYTVNDRKIDILVRSQEQERNQISDLNQLIINPESKMPIRLDAVATINQTYGPAAINRIDQQRVALVTANLSYGDLEQGIHQANQVLSQLSLPRSIQVNFGGQNEEMQASFDSLKIALLLAICLVYFVMASQFESLLHPLLILAVIPMALSGAIYGLYFSQTPLSVVVFIGVIMLSGIVVNNAIVLIDRINQLRQQGLEKMAAIYQGACSRLRPIMMTTLTTSLGLLPMLMSSGEGHEIRAPMAISVIAGLLLSTLLTLVVIPSLYAVFDRKQFSTHASETNTQEAQS